AALQIFGVTKSFGATHVLRGVTMEVMSGEVMCLIGPNGAGKTTLLRIITGDQILDDGQIQLFDQDVSTWSTHARSRASLGMVFQIPSIFPDLTPRPEPPTRMFGSDKPGTPA